MGKLCLQVGYDQLQLLVFLLIVTQVYLQLLRYAEGSLQVLLQLLYLQFIFLLFELECLQVLLLTLYQLSHLVTLLLEFRFVL